MHSHPCLRHAAGSLFLVVALWLAFLPAAQAQQLRIIRDAEVEQFVKDLARPLLNAAGLTNVTPRIFIVADRRFNAFVVDGGDMFINYGTILDVDSPNELQAIIAHEIAHLAGGHLSNIRQRADATAIMQVVAMAMGLGAATAGSAAGISQIGGIASAFILASQSAGVNSLMAYRRSEESAADSAAIEFLTRAGLSTRGMVEVMATMVENSPITAGASPYLRSHPEPRERLERVRQTAQASPTWSRQPAADTVRDFEMVRAKITGFLESQQTTIDRYPNSDRSRAARYARIITAYRSGAGISAVQLMPGLISEDPANPYFRELFGQMLLETGRPGDAASELRRAVERAPDQPLIRQMYGHALVEAGGSANLEEATAQLSRAARETGNNPGAHALLSRAYAALGRPGEASLAAAEAALARGEQGTALGLARQARDALPQGSPSWLRADDILSIR